MDVSQTPLLEVNDFSIRYSRGQWNEKKVVDRLDLRLQGGDYLVLTGANGSGKSTFLKALSGDLVPDAATGTVRLAGRDLLALPPAEKFRMLGVIDQDPTMGTCEHLLAHEQISLAGKDFLPRIEERLARLGSTIDLRQRIQTLSGGQRQLLTALIAIERQPLLLLADEPTAALDAHFAPVVSSLLEERIGAPDVVTIVVSHQNSIPTGKQVRLLRIQAHQWVEVSG